MRNEWVRTGLFAAVAAALTAAAISFQPESRKAEIFSDTGEVFFPNFRDVTKVTAIEVVDYDEAEAVARPLKVELRKGRYLLTSHADYPAEAKERISKTATALLDLKKDAAVSDRFEDHGTYGVIDPLDAKNPSLTGRGKRVTLKDSGGTTLAEVVMGGAVKGKPGSRYVRLPGQKRTYAVATDADPSAQFADWVEPNLLRVSAGEVTKLTLNSYQIDEQFGRLVNQQRTTMERGTPTWDAKAQAIAATMASLRVVGARAKPPQLAEQLKSKQLMLSLETVMSLRQRGYFITPTGALLSNEGELIAETDKGVNYVLRFGEVVSDASTSAAPGKSKENRFLFVTVGARKPEAEATETALTAKFADWYYVISGADFAKLHPVRAAQLSQAKPAGPAPPPGVPPGMQPPPGPPPGPPRQ